MKTRELLPILALIAGAQTTASAAPTGSIEGTLIEQPENKVVTGSVDLVCGKVRTSVRADGAGHFQITGLPEGRCTLTANGGGFVTVTLGVMVSSGSIATVLVGVTSRATAERMRRDEERARKEQEKYAKDMRRDRLMKKPSRMGGIGGPGRAVDMDLGDVGGAERGGAGGIAPPPAMDRPMPAAAPPHNAPASPAKRMEIDATVTRAAERPMGNAGPVAAKVAVLEQDVRRDEAKRRELVRRNNADKKIGTGRILSTDQRDFRAYRWKHRKPFKNLLLQ